ncbi:MAG: EamA family transporter [Sneathiella sp.]
MVHGLLFSVSGIFIKTLVQDIDIFKQIFYRTAFSVIAITTIYKPKFSECFNVKALPSSGSRGIFGFLGVSSMFYAITELPLTIAMTLTLTTPAFVMILGHSSITEKIQLRQFSPAF